MITKLPGWIWMVSWVLTFGAGIVNAVGLLGFQHQAVTHLTGTTTLLGSSLASGNSSEVLHVGLILASFVGGAALSGLLLPSDPLKLDWRHALALLLEALLLFAAVPLLNGANEAGDCLASAACGLQNGMATIFSGALIRTTHVSGMFTDLGIFLGHALRGLGVDRRRMKLCLNVISAFLSGGVVGALGFRHLGYATLFIPGTVVGLGALGFGVARLGRGHR